jgi:L-threonylcarbamoyladenylate synthase
VPQHPFLLALLESTGVLLVTSANRHGAPTPASATDAAEGLAPHVTLAIDGGPLDATPSTLVNVHLRSATVEREGAIPRAAIVATLADQVAPS